MSSVAEKLQRKSQRQTSVKQVRLKLVYIDFWSAVKFSFLVAVSLGIVLVVASLLIWIVLNSTGIFGKLDEIFRDVLSDETFSVATSLVDYAKRSECGTLVSAQRGYSSGG